MPFKDPQKMAEYMRARRAENKKVNRVNRVNAKPLTRNVNPERKPVNLNGKIQVSGSYEDNFWIGICPECGFGNMIDPRRSFRPEVRCEHYLQLSEPGQPSNFIFKKVNKVNVNPLTPSVNPVNPESEKKTWIKLDHSMEKSQIILKESHDGITWRTITILRKDQSFERNGLIILGTWHRGSGKEVIE
jgi:hypothetical protein